MVSSLKHKKETKLLLFLIPFFLILISIAGIIYASFLFWNGFHSFDLGHNYRYIECRFNTTVVDLASDGNTYTPNNMVIKGIRSQVKGFYLGLFSAFVFGFSLIQLIISRRNKK